MKIANVDKTHVANFWMGDDKWEFSSPDLQMLSVGLMRFARINLFTKLMGEVLLFPKRIVNVGACIGCYSLVFHYIFPNAEIVALEPSSNNYPYLLHNTSHASRIKAYQLAASDKREMVTLSVPSLETKELLNMGDQNCGLISIYGDTDILRNEVLAVRLDDLVDSVDFIKIDAEGHDYPVLLGAQRLLDESRPALLIEFNHSNFQMSGFSAENISDLLLRYSYTVVARIHNDFLFVPFEKAPGVDPKMQKVVAKNNEFTIRRA